MWAPSTREPTTSSWSLIKMWKLRARIMTVLRRRHGQDEGTIRIGEFALLRTLAGDPRRAFKKSELLEATWDPQPKNPSRALDAHTSRLRRKLDPQSAKFVVNCRGVGYRLIER
jgi:DNA-binding response OmpR family regulator